MFCKKCGKELTSDAFMCVNCGTLTDVGNTVKQKSLRKNASQNVTLGIAGLIFSLFFQLVTFILSAVGLCGALKEMREVKAQQDNVAKEWKGAEASSMSAEKGIPALNYSESGALPQIALSQKMWECVKAFQLNLTALILAGTLTLVIVLTFL